MRADIIPAVLISLLTLWFGWIWVKGSSPIRRYHRRMHHGHQGR